MQNMGTINWAKDFYLNICHVDSQTPCGRLCQRLLAKWNTEKYVFETCFLIRSLSGYRGGFDFLMFNHQNTGEQCAC